MHASKLVQVLRNLSKEEIKDFDAYLQASVLSNRKGGEKSLLLFKSIYKYYPEFAAAKLKKENIFKKIYPEEVYQNTGKFEKLMSKLLNLLQEFIIYQKSDLERDLYQLRIMNDFFAKNNLDGFAKTNIKKYQKLFKEKEVQDSLFFHEVFLFERQLIRHQLFSNNFKTINFSTVHLSLDTYYIFEKLELACRLLAIRRFLFPIPIGNSLVTLEHLTPLLENDFYEAPLIKVYYRAFKFLNSSKEKTEECFQVFEQTLNRYTRFMPKEQLNTLVTIIRNYCVTQYHHKTEGYLEKVFNVYKEHLEKQYLYVDGKLFASTLMNMVVFGLRLKRFDWVYDLIQAHKERITGIASAVDAYHLNLANYYFHVKNYEEVLNLLMVDYEDVYYKLKAKRMEIQTYFELDHVLLESKMDAFKIFIFRFSEEKISIKHKDGNRDFIDVLKQIKLPKTYKNEKRIEKLINKINNSTYINEKEWLLEKLENLR